MKLCLIILLGAIACWTSGYYYALYNHERNLCAYEMPEGQKAIVGECDQ